MSKLQEITHQVTLLFREFGIKSMTMDDISKSMGISKKTLYKFVKDKNDLVDKVIEHSIKEKQHFIEKITSENTHPIDELFSIAKYSSKEISSINPSLQFDLKKYHPNAWLLFEEHKQSFVFNCVLDNLKEGIKIGVYRKNINPEIVAKLHTSSIPLVFDSSLFPTTEFSFKDVFSELMKHHIRGISTEDGLKYLKKLIKNDTNNPLL
ncbi:MAG: TetR/AcrR family transcriptional regulator [Flavobacteriales bacterium]|jgi:TetR/AcrR family transcriptional regulator, cholesterol catabolism regulator|nr:TetR/AcrR family transcriptional regulator [Flavobacteriales bacterium]